ncbi:hypothetical protein D3C77_536740 [compost metagenome]
MLRLQVSRRFLQINTQHLCACCSNPCIVDLPFHFVGNRPIRPHPYIYRGMSVAGPADKETFGDNSVISTFTLI